MCLYFIYEESDFTKIELWLISVAHFSFVYGKDIKAFIG